MAGFIVAGFYTGDYAKWLPALTASLDAHGAPHDFIQIDKIPGSSWEANTLRKAGEVLEAMGRHPASVIVFLDVDAVIRGDLAPLADIAGDIAFYVTARRRRNGAVKFRVRSGTLVIRPTTAARRFVEAWAEISRTAAYGDVDQVALMLAIGRVPGVSFTPLDIRYCATAGDRVADPVILHDQASRDTPKVGPWQRLVRGLLGRWRSRGSIGAPCAN